MQYTISDFKGMGVYKLPSNTLPDYDAERQAVKSWESETLVRMSLFDSGQFRRAEEPTDIKALKDSILEQLAEANQSVYERRRRLLRRCR